MASRRKRPRVLLAKPNLDGHWTGMAVVATALRDAGMEVVYGGMLGAEEIFHAALQEDVDVIGLSLGGRYQQVRELMDRLREHKVDHVLVIAGGTVPPDEIPLLKGMGIAEVFPPGSSLDSIVRFIEERTSGSEIRGHGSAMVSRSPSEAKEIH